MKRWTIAAVIVCSLLRLARADDGDQVYRCHPASPTTKISVTFKPDASLRDLVTWVLGFSCKNVVYSADVAAYADNLTLVTPTELTPKQAMQLFVDALESVGLVVVQKPDTIIIKLGPGMARTCPAVAAAAPPPTAPPSAPIAASVDDGLNDADLDGIREIDANHHEIKRAVKDKVLANPIAALGGARMVPSLSNGKPVGFKVFVIRPRSFLARIGLLNADMITAINGEPLTSADQALEAYTKLRDARELEIAVVRHGKPTTLVLSIR